MSAYTFAQKAKAVVAFVGAVATGALAMLANTGVLDYEVAGQSVGYWLAGLVAVATYVAAFQIPNAPTEEPAPPVEPQVEDTH